MQRTSKYLLCILSLVIAIGLWLKATVIQVPSGTWVPAGNMAEARSGAASVLLQDGTILVTGGESASVTLASAEFFTAGVFTAAPAMNVARKGHTAVVLQDGRMLVAGGKTTGDGVTNAAEVYSPALNSWIVIGSMADARSGHTATVLKDGRVLLAGGEGSAGTVSTLEVFDPVTGSFAFVGTMSSARKEHAAALLADGRVLIAGGSDGANALSSTQIYDPETGTAMEGPVLSTPRAGMSATTLMDGKVLIAGGNNGTVNLATAEVFNPTTGTVSLLGSSLAGTRRGHSAFLLPHNNHVLIVGGTSGETSLATTVIFRPWDGDFYPTGSMSVARGSFSGAPLGSDGLLLIAGGNGLASSELYGFATIKTDKDDYAPGELVTMTGSGWQPGETVTLFLHEINNPDPHDDLTLTALADASGKIVNSQFAPDEHDLGIRFYLTASGSNSQAQTTFTDSQAWTLVISPTSVQTSSTNTFTLTATDTGTNNEQIGCVQVTVPSQFTSLGSAAIISPAGWTASLSGQILQAVANSNSLKINPTQDVRFSVQGTAPSSTTGSPFTWSGAAFANINCSSNAFPAPASQPTVAVTPAFSVTFNATPIADVDAAATGLSVTVGANPATLVTRSELPKTFGGISSGTSISYSYNSPLAVSSSKQYRWLSTAGTGSASTQTGQSGSFSVTSSSSVTATYQAQYQVSFKQSGLTADATGTVLTLTSGNKGFGDFDVVEWFDAGAAVTYSYADPVTSSVAGKRYARTGVSPASIASLSGATTVTGSYKVQYEVSFKQSGLTADATGTVLTLTSGNKGFGDFDVKEWFDAAGAVTYSYADPVTSSEAGKRYARTGVSPASIANLSGATTVTGSYKVQYEVTFKQSGLTADATGTVLTLTSGNKGFGDFDVKEWFDAAGAVTYSYADPVTSSEAGKRYARTGVSPASIANLSGATTVTGSYKVQYEVTFKQSGLAADATGTVLTLASGNKGFGDFDVKEWFDAAGAVTYSYADPVTSSEAGKRYARTGVSPASIASLSGATTVTGSYKVQYEVTFKQSGLAVDATGTVLTLASGNKGFGDFDVKEWFDAAGAVTYSYADPVTSSEAGKRYARTGVSPASIANLSGATTVTGSYKTQYQVTFKQSGLTADATGTVLTVASGNKGFLDFDVVEWSDAGGAVTYSYTDPVTSSVAGKRYARTGVSPASIASLSGATTVTGSYKIQYFLTITTNPSPVSRINVAPADGWFDSGYPVSLNATSPVSGGPGVGYVFNNWTGDVPVPNPNGANPLAIAMNQPRTITANYNTLVLTWDATNTFNAQYSDPTQLKAVLILNGVAATGRSINFAVGSDTGSATTDSSGLAMDTTKLTQAPGNYSASATCSVLVCGVPLSISYNSFKINQEDARVQYDPAMVYFSTPSASTPTALVTLRAVIQDISAIGGDPDVNPGNITKARVTFVNRDAPGVDTPFSAACSNLTPVLLDSSDSKTGVVSCTTTLSGGSSSDPSTQYMVGIVVNNYYARNASQDDTMVTVVLGGVGNVSAGGYLVNELSSGQVSGTVEAKSGFGFNLSFNKSGSNVQGHARIRINRLESGVWKKYDVKSTSVTSLTTQNTTGTTGTAQFISKANLTEISSSLTPLSLSGLQLIMTIVDNGEPGRNDTIGITLWDGNTLVFSSRWTGTGTAQQLLGGGNLQVKK